MHTVAITDRWVVFFDLPAIFDLDAAMAGAGFPYRWNEDYEARVGVRPVEGGGIKWMSVDPCYVFHVLNGHDVGDSMLSLELSVYPSVYARDVHGPNDGPPTLHRWTVDVDAGVIKDEQLDDRQSEFPRVDPRRHAAAHRFGYLMAFADGDGEAAFTPTGLLKRDSQRGAGGPRLRAGSRTRRADLRSTLGGRSGG